MEHCFVSTGSEHHHEEFLVYALNEREPILTNPVFRYNLCRETAFQYDFYGCVPMSQEKGFPYKWSEI